jgi:hypothetical protein
VVTGVSPDAMFGFAPGVAWRATRGFPFPPAVRLAFLRATTGALTAGHGTASFTWTVGRADGCIQWGARSAARLLGCLRLEAGVLQGTGRGYASARNVDTAWVAAGPLVRGEWALLPPLFVAAELAAMVHATQDYFYFLPNVTVYQVPPLGFEGAAGVGVQFP